jgi:hypothetical protein
MTGYDVPSHIMQSRMAEAQKKALETGKPVEMPSAFVELTKDEIASVKVESSKDINVTLICEERQLDPLVILETNYLMNDGTTAAAEAESVLIEAMRGKVGIATLTRGGRQKLWSQSASTVTGSSSTRCAPPTRCARCPIGRRCQRLTRRWWRSPSSLLRQRKATSTYPSTRTNTPKG